MKKKKIQTKAMAIGIEKIVLQFGRQVLLCCQFYQCGNKSLNKINTLPVVNYLWLHDSKAYVPNQ